MTTLDAAQHYHALGWSLIPIEAGTKIPPRGFKWGQYQSEAADIGTVRRWFVTEPTQGVAVVLGQVSGGLVCRDFDEMQAYSDWARERGTLADMLPTVATSRGRHVYALADVAQVRQASKTGSGMIRLGDGEMRAEGCYCVLPPSVHPSGAIYHWQAALPSAPIPHVDLLEAGFLPSATPATESHREAQRVQRGQRKTEEIGVFVGGAGGGCSWGASSGGGYLDAADPVAIEPAIMGALPTGPGQRHRQVFELARALKAIPALADADPKELKGYVRRWHDLAKPVINTQAFEESWIDFLKAWPKVKFPKGAEPMAQLLANLDGAEYPQAALQFETPAVQTLVLLCRELQRAAGAEPFFLACRTAGRLLSVDHSSASRYLFLLVQEGVLALIEQGQQASRKASRYRYLGDL